MRRIAALVLIGLGVFLLVLAPMVKWYLEPRAAKAPLDRDSTSVATSAGDSTVLDAGTLTIRKGLTLTAFRQVRGDVAAGSSSHAVWDEFLRVTDESNNRINVTTDRVAFDRVTAMAVNCCGEMVDGDTTARHDGLSYKFPFGTQHADYPYFDGTLKRSFPMVYQGEETRDHLTVYHFKQIIQPASVESLSVPPALVGLTGSSAMDVNRFYANARDVWVEPSTGIIVYGEEHQVQTLHDASGGRELLTVFDATLRFTPQTERAAADEARTGASQLGLLRTGIPVAALVLGLLALGGGLFLAQGSGGRAAQQAQPEPGQVDVRPFDQLAAQQPVDLTAAEDATARRDVEA